MLGKNGTGAPLAIVEHGDDDDRGGMLDVFAPCLPATRQQDVVLVDFEQLSLEYLLAVG